MSRLPIVFVTGLSGAGLSVTLNALEDLGYETVDNLPLMLLDGLGLSPERLTRPLALAINARTRDFSAQALTDQMARMRQEAGLDVELMFVDCGDETLRRRFSETRRRHPLAKDRSVPDAISIERRLVEPLRDVADWVVDTTDMTPQSLRRMVVDRFRADRTGPMQVFVISFGFRNGIPRDADMVFDVRFLANPHYQTALRPLTGLDDRVGQVVRDDPMFADFFARLAGFVEPLLPRMEQEGKTYLTLAIGCTGGRHRSVYIAERLAERLQASEWPVTVEHRDIVVEPATTQDARPNAA